MNKKPVLWLIAGTSEGRRLIKELKNENIHIVASVATEYGKNIIEKQGNLEVISRRLNKDDMVELIKTLKPFLVVDATHPYAVEVTNTIKEALRETKTEYLRLVRQKGDTNNCIEVNNFEEAVEFLTNTTGNIFLTTGSKTLEVFTKIPNFSERVTLRILPMLDSLKKAIELNFKPASIICMQGPFFKDLNEAMFKQAKAKYVVTKDTGSVGGFNEKKLAAKNAGAKLVVIKRQVEEMGESFDLVVSDIKNRMHM